MYALRRPDTRAIQAYLDDRANAPFNYDDVGAAHGLDPARPGELGARYFVRGIQVSLGRGPQVYARAREALLSGRVFDGWMRLCFPTGEIEPGRVFGLLIRTGPLWALNPLRVTTTVSEERRFGFSWGTLSGHPLAGEERFSVEQLDDEAVQFEVTSFSRPAGLAERAGAPFVRLLQRRFDRSTGEAMQRETA